MPFMVAGLQRHGPDPGGTCTSWNPSISLGHPVPGQVVAGLAGSDGTPSAQPVAVLPLKVVGSHTEPVSGGLWPRCLARSWESAEMSISRIRTCEARPGTPVHCPGG